MPTELCSAVIRRAAAGTAATMQRGCGWRDGCNFEVAMAEQDLNGAQVSSCLKKMGRETVAQRVGMDAPVVEASPFGGNLTGAP